MNTNAPLDSPEILLNTPTWLINQLSIHSHRIMGDRFAEVCARRPHFSLLATLEERGPMSQAVLSRCTGIDRSDIVSAINELEAKGYVVRAVNPSDRRRNVITITSAGQEHYQQLNAIRAAAQQELLAGISPAEREVLADLLRRAFAELVRSGASPSGGISVPETKQGPRDPARG